METISKISNFRSLPYTLFWVIIICTFTLPNVTLSQTVDTLWAEGWEGNWITNWHVDAGTWDVGIPTSGPNNAHNGQKCAATVIAGDYSEPVDSRLIRHTSFVVPAAQQHPRLRFWHWYSFSTADSGYVQIKVGSGQWQTIGGPYVNTGSGVWTYPSIDLSHYAGSTVQLAFYFHSQQDWLDPDVSTGWYVDDVAIVTGTIVLNSPENFESGIGDWSVDYGTWEIGKPTSGPDSAYEGHQCAATVLSGDYAEPVDSRLTSPPMLVPSASQYPRLRFWHWYSFSTSDSGYVQIKVGSGPWQTIGGPYVNTGSGVWTYPSIDLSPYAGSSVQLAFYFHSQQDWLDPDVSSGWYVDEVTIVTGPIVFNSPENFESGIGDWSVDYGTWEVGKSKSGPDSAYEGQKCAATVLGGDYAEPVDSRLTSTPVFVPSASQYPRLRFWHWYSFSTSDSGYAQIKVGSGQWQTIGGPYVNTGSGVWTYPSIDLSPYAGSSVQLAFYFHSQQDWLDPDVSAGWYIDDVAIVTGPIVFNNPENFDPGIGDWSVDYGTWEVGKPTSGPDSAYEGQKCAATVLSGDYAEPVDSRLISPPIRVPSLDQNPNLRFWHWYSFSTSDTGYVQIRIINHTWQTLGVLTGTSSGIWTIPFYDLTPYADSTVQIAFFFHSEQDWLDPDVSTGWYIDHVYIIGSTSTPVAPLLFLPQDGVINQPKSLVLQWHPTVAADSYNVQLSTLSNFSVGGIVVNSTVADTFKSISGLRDSTLYYWRVNAKNIAGTSPWSTVWSFTTIVPSSSLWVLVSRHS